VEQFQQQLAAAEDTFDKDPTPLNRLILGGSQYSNTLYVRGDNTVAKAVAAGALNARDLYPDFAPKSLADFAKGWYRTSPVLPRRV
jgi:ABC-type hemin transport system substrate-binding protein